MIPESKLQEVEFLMTLDYCPSREEEIAGHVPALIAEVRRLREANESLIESALAVVEWTNNQNEPFPPLLKRLELRARGAKENPCP